MMDKERLKLIETLEKFPCSLNGKHKMIVTKLHDGKWTLSCPDCIKEIGISHQIKGEVKNIKIV